VSGYVTASGEFTTSVTVISTDNEATIIIPAGTIGTTATGQPLSSITVTQVLEPPSPPPTGDNIISTMYEFGPPGAHFSPPITMTLSYDPTLLGEGVPEIAYYSVSDGAWITLGGVVDTFNHTITVEVDHFTVFAVMGYGTPKTPTIANSWWLWTIIIVVVAILLFISIRIVLQLRRRRRLYR
jgi:hypothetical protein